MNGIAESPADGFSKDKKTGGAALGTIVAWNSIANKANAQETEGEVANSNAHWWDMKCSAPDAGGGNVNEQDSTPGGPGAFNATIELNIDTSKIADLLEDAGYLNAGIIHDFSFRVTSITESNAIFGSSAFDVSCDSQTGLIRSTLSQISSNPSSNGTMTQEFIMDGYKVTLSLIVVRDQGGSDVFTTLKGKFE